MDNLTRIFWNQGLNYANHNPNNSETVGHRIFKCFYGVSPNVCSAVWRMFQNTPPNAEPKHLLWALLFLKRYNTEHINAAIVGTSEKTFREWAWELIDMLAELSVVIKYILYW